MTFAPRAQDHPRSVQMFNAKCSKCGDQTRVPWDPVKEPKRVIMCKNCRLVYG